MVSDWSNTVFSTQDATSPVSSVATPSNASTVGPFTLLSGSADDAAGSGVSKVGVSLRRNADSRYWTGTYWSATTEQWLAATLGAGNAWTYDASGVTWGSAEQYTVRSRAEDNVGNVEAPGAGNTFTFLVPSIAITAPNGGERWERRTQHSLTWTPTSNAGATVKIELLRAGSLDSVIASTTANDGEFPWDIPSGQTPGADYGVRVTSVSEPDATDVSDATFEITSPAVTGATPNVGFNQGTRSVTIQGTGFVSPAMVKIARSTEIAATNVRVVSGTQIACDLPLTGAEAGTWDVVVTNASGNVVTLTGGFTILPAAAPGLQMISLPLALTNPAPESVFGAGVKMARWQKDAYRGTSATTYAGPIDPLGAGRAHWVKVEASGLPLAADVTGSLADQTTEQRLPLAEFADGSKRSGWYQVGTKFLRSVNWADVKVSANGAAPTDLVTAYRNGKVLSLAWAFDPASSSHAMVSSIFPGARTTLDPCAGYWVKRLSSDPNETVELVLPPPTRAGRSASPPAAKRSGTDWMIQLVAECGALRDAANYCGVWGSLVEAHRAPGGRLSVESPPPLGSFVDLSFVTGTPGSRYAIDLLKEPAGKMAWEVEVVTDQSEGEVTLTWPDLSSLPRRYQPVLTDLATGESVYMRTARAYRYRSGRAQEPRRLRLEVVHGSQGALRISTATVIRTRDGGLLFSYLLSQPAEVTCVLRGPSGRTVSTLQPAKPARAGLNQFAWADRGPDGRALPKGAYLWEILAVDETGRAVRAVRVAVKR
jgi:hypothetical protein